MELDGTPLRAIFGSPDDLKFRSSITLLDAIRPPTAQFSALPCRSFVTGIATRRRLRLFA
nr:DUF1810 family protein [Tianweitania sediminis]